MSINRKWIVGLDADDTLWHNERFFTVTTAQFAALLADYADPDDLGDRLLATERRNLARYGFGIKGYVLSMIETAIEITDAQVPTTVIAELISLGREMLAHPIDLLPQVQTTVETLANSAHLILITKGDLLHQEQKLAHSGLGDLFHDVHIVSDKNAATYARIFAPFDGGNCVMVGDSLKSDVVPAIDAGAWGVHVPHGTPWALDLADAPVGHPRFHAIPNLGMLPQLLETLP